jgi:hypothetical protein
MPPELACSTELHRRPASPQAPAAIRRTWNRPPWNAHPLGDPGEPSTGTTPVKWIGQMVLMGVATLDHLCRQNLCRR